MGSLLLNIEHRQQQAMSPRLQRAVRLLQLSSLDFAQEVHNALGSNPFLEADETDEETPADEAQAGERDDEAGAGHEAAKDADADADSDAERESWQADGISPARGPADGDVNLMEMRAIEVSLREHLHGQLNVLSLPPRDMLLAKVIVESLDDDGYLRFELADLARVSGLDPAPAADELQIALNLVQSLDPAGIGARSVAECLLLQLPAIADVRERETVRRIVGEHLDALAAKDMAGLARRLGCSVAEAQHAADSIRRLDPRPGWRFGAPNIQYVTPDVIVKKIRGEWTASLNPAIVPKVRLNHVYAEMFQRNRSAQHAELAAHLQEARWTISNVAQRFSTILSVAEAIVKRQKHFLEYGALAMKPLGLREIADEVGVHESTVSRVTNNKYMSTPLGVFELKYFFSRAMLTASGGKCSATAIRGLIKDMIAAERPQAPLSDAEIARQLARQGLVVARRTVTKYRQILKIEAVERRRKCA
jgi:RNA polymerase sigma-54 factor